VARCSETLRATIPTLVSAEQLARLKDKGLRIERNPMAPGERKDVKFRRDVDLLIHELGGLDLTAAEHVVVVVQVESTGAVLDTIPQAPFDRERGVLLLACQAHFAALPPDIVLEVHAVAAGGAEVVTRYTVLHEWEPRALDWL